MNKEALKKVVNIRAIGKTLWHNKKRLLIVWIVTFALSCLWILPQPRYYTTEVSIAPETENDKLGGGTLASIASNFGMNLGANSNGDAIYPQLYPDLFKSTNFLVGLLDIRVKTQDGKIDTDYYTYMKKHQKHSFWAIGIGKIRSLFSEKVPDENPQPDKDGKRFDPFRLSKTTSDVIGQVSANINCTYSRTTDVVTITVKDQDPLVCALLADSIKEHLQTFITDYRTKKSRNDYEYFKKMTEEAKAAYDQARKEYADFCDANNGAVMQDVKTKMESLENEMSIKYELYTNMNAQMETALAKVQQNTPVFTTLTNATVPIKPAGPKRMIFVAAMLFLATIGTVIYLLRKELKEWF